MEQDDNASEVDWMEASLSNDTITSNRDVIATDSEWMATSAEKKDFNFENRSLTFKAVIGEEAFSATIKS